jgi:hypothetical protein
MFWPENSRHTTNKQSLPKPVCGSESPTRLPKSSKNLKQVIFRLCHPFVPSYKCTTYQTIHSVSLEAIFIISQAMPIDLNTLLDPHGELLPDLNEQPAYEQQDEIMSV